MAAISNDSERKRRPTAIDVAKAAGVSQSAVSRSFTPGASVSRDVRDRVHAAATVLHYRPNAMARAIMTRRSGLVAIVIAIDTNLQYPEALSELARALSRGGRHIMLFAIDAMSEVDAVVDQIWAYQVDSVVALVDLTDQQVSLLEEHDVPVVLYNRLPGRRIVSSVGCDHVGCGRLLAEHLLSCGATRFAIVEGPAHSSVATERLAGVLGELERAGVADIVRAPGDYTYDAGVAAVASLGGAALVGRALIAANDMMALGALDALRSSYGLVVPAQVMVAGFDGIGATRWIGYQLTTVRQPIRRMAEATSTMVAERVEGSSQAERRAFAGELMIGQSTAKAQSRGSHPSPPAASVTTVPPRSVSPA